MQGTLQTHIDFLEECVNKNQIQMNLVQYLFLSSSPILEKTSTDIYLPKRITKELNSKEKVRTFLADWSSKGGRIDFSKI
jgi:hypothetical protein